MKIRCDQNSIRLRLRKSEVDTLMTETELRTAVAFPGGPDFSWTLRFDAAVQTIQASNAAGALAITVPLQQGRDWCSTDVVGIETRITLPDGGSSLHILIEKDFPCKDRPDEDPSDFFQELAAATPPRC